VDDDAVEKILIVDDDAHLRERLVAAFAGRDFEARGAGSYDEAMTLLEDFAADRAVIDLKMPGKSGLELARDALAVRPALRVVILTGYGSIATAMEAVRIGAVSYLPKPADVDDILAAFDPESRVNSLPEGEDIPTPSLARAEWEHINRVLADCGGNISAAARRLNIHRRTLQRKLMKYPPPK